jgi:NADPH:quinone reductase-like Zn-dependent oxidoreductase
VLEPLSEGFAKGHFAPVVAESFEFERAADAHRFLGEGRNVGKVVLTPD